MATHSTGPVQVWRASGAPSALARSSLLLLPHYLSDRRSLAARRVCQTRSKNVKYRENRGCISVSVGGL